MKKILKTLDTKLKINTTQQHEFIIKYVIMFMKKYVLSEKKYWWWNICSEESKNGEIEWERKGKRVKWGENFSIGAAPKYLRIQGGVYWRSISEFMVSYKVLNLNIFFSIVMEYSDDGDLF